VAVTFEGIYRGRVDAMVVVSPLFHLRRLWRVRVAALLLDIAMLFVRFLPVRQKKERVDYSMLQHLSDESPRRIWYDISATGLRVYLYCLKQIYSFAHDTWWKTVSVSVLVLYGTHDTVMPESYVRAFIKDIPRATLQVIPNGSHMLVYNNTEEVATEIEQFVQDVCVRAQTMSADLMGQA
jgi:pimeloyl-ACP methyl ester carboxylesterase